MLPKTAEYGLRAIVCLGRDPAERQSADEIAKLTQVPRRYLHKVLQDLGKAGLVRSQPGPGGGYSLAREAESITILDVVNAVGQIERIRVCPLGLKSHSELCPLHQEVDKAYATVEAAFARVTIGQVLSASNFPLPLCDASSPVEAVGERSGGQGL